MTQTIEWARVRDGGQLLLGDEAAADGNAPDDSEATAGNIAVVVEGCAIYGQPAEMLEFFADAISKISAHLAGQP